MPARTKPRRTVARTVERTYVRNRVRRIGRRLVREQRAAAERERLARTRARGWESVRATETPRIVPRATVPTLPRKQFESPAWMQVKGYAYDPRSRTLFKGASLDKVGKEYRVLFSPRASTVRKSTALRRLDRWGYEGRRRGRVRLVAQGQLPIPRQQFKAYRQAGHPRGAAAGPRRCTGVGASRTG